MPAKTIKQGLNPKNQQTGVVLIITLIFLVLLLMLGLTSANYSTIATKIAINHQFKQLSFQAAESAFARLLSPAPNALKPATVESDPIKNGDYFVSENVINQADISTDMTIDFIEVSVPGQYKYSGFGLSVVSLLYQADAVGRVDGSNAKAHNRMQVTLIRD
ncbi:MAG: hypothetical protein KAG19_08850 [Methylococcales bacterium]|nr:hypothetical protein [Methylococcales bacterium]